MAFARRGMGEKRCNVAWPEAQTERPPTLRPRPGPGIARRLRIAPRLACRWAARGAAGRRCRCTARSHPRRGAGRAWPARPAASSGRGLVRHAEVGRTGTGNQARDHHVGRQLRRQVTQLPGDNRPAAGHGQTPAEVRTTQARRRCCHGGLLRKAGRRGVGSAQPCRIGGDRPGFRQSWNQEISSLFSSTRFSWPLESSTLREHASAPVLWPRAASRRHPLPARA